MGVQCRNYHIDAESGPELVAAAGERPCQATLYSDTGVFLLDGPGANVTRADHQNRRGSGFFLHKEAILTVELHPGDQTYASVAHTYARHGTVHVLLTQ